MWGYTPGFLDELEARFPAFLQKALVENPAKAEFFLPLAVEQLLREDKATVKVLESPDKWYGVTYAADKPQIVVANKMDDEFAPMYLEEFRKKYPDLKVYETSTLMHKGLDEVLYAAMDAIEQAREEEAESAEETEETVVYRYEPKKPDFTIEVLGPGRYKVVSEKIDRLFDTIDFDKEEEAYQFASTLSRMGVDQALRDAGCKDGDQVIVGTFIMDFKE